MSEFDDAVKLARRVLDKPYIDPDGDICMLARQFERLVEINAQQVRDWNARVIFDARQADAIAAERAKAAALMAQNAHFAKVLGWGDMVSKDPAALAAAIEAVLACRMVRPLSPVEDAMLRADPIKGMSEQVREICDAAAALSRAWHATGPAEASSPSPRGSPPSLPPYEDEMSDELGWFLPASAINELQAESIEKLVAHAKRANYVNAIVRKDGRETPYQADWIKHMRMVGKP